ncbi:MAG: hypothetical protein WAK16_02855 [Candidatus Cybelea sp.]
MLMFLHALAFALGLCNGIGGDYGHEASPGYVQSTDGGESMPMDGGGTMPA